MKYEESSTVELKEIVSDSLKKEVIAFANTQGGVIYVGVRDDGSVCGLKNYDETAQKVANMIRDNICPDVSMFVSYEKIEENGKAILKLTVQEGTGKPYYLASKGMRSDGVSVRQGTASAPASNDLIRKMIKESDGDDFETARSLEQELSFTSAAEEFSKRKIEFGSSQQRTLGLINKDGMFTNLALLLSDQCPHTVKPPSFRGRIRMSLPTAVNF